MGCALVRNGKGDAKIEAYIVRTREKLRNGEKELIARKHTGADLVGPARGCDRRRRNWHHPVAAVLVVLNRAWQIVLLLRCLELLSTRQQDFARRVKPPIFSESVWDLPWTILPGSPNFASTPQDLPSRFPHRPLRLPAPPRPWTAVTHPIRGKILGHFSLGER
jgi:hypothetical protein